jgi:flotillin
MPSAVVVAGAVVGGVGLLVALFAYLVLHDVPAGAIRLVTWPHGATRIYRGPAKSRELLGLATGVTISRSLIGVELDLTDQTADTDRSGHPRPVEVRVQATALVSVGDSDELIRIAAERFFTIPEERRLETVKQYLSSACRDALHRLTHDHLYSAVDAPLVVTTLQGCEPDLAQLGLVVHSFRILSVHSEVAVARRRQAAAEAQAEAQIVAAAQARRGREAELEAERLVSEKERELAQTRAQNSALIAEATARQQEVQARAGAERIRIEAEAAQQALRGAQFGLTLDEALRITKIAATQADGFRKINDAIREGEDSFFRYRLIEMLPQLTPGIAEALANSKLLSNSNASAASSDGLNSVLQAALAQQLRGNGGIRKLVAGKRQRRGSERPQR